MWDVFSNDEMAVFVERHANAAREGGRKVWREGREGVGRWEGAKDKDCKCQSPSHLKPQSSLPSLPPFLPLPSLPFQSTYLAELADDIVKESMRRGSRDNITALVVRLPPPNEGERRALFM